MKNKLSVLVFMSSLFLYGADVTVWISNVNLDQNTTVCSIQ